MAKDVPVVGYSAMTPPSRRSSDLDAKLVNAWTRGKCRQPITQLSGEHPISGFRRAIRGQLASWPLGESDNNACVSSLIPKLGVTAVVYLSYVTRRETPLLE